MVSRIPIKSKLSYTEMATHKFYTTFFFLLCIFFLLTFTVTAGSHVNLSLSLSLSHMHYPCIANTNFDVIVINQSLYFVADYSGTERDRSLHKTG